MVLFPEMEKIQRMGFVFQTCYELPSRHPGGGVSHLISHVNIRATPKAWGTSANTLFQVVRDS